ncbi:MAG: hypothetical protein OER59_06260 [Desulfobulbaceae bacterium]|nr:hypothetical protein [Desulfobulbaceae bacterium]
MDIEVTMSEAIRISQEETRQKVLGGQALLVCAYADDAKFARYQLEGAISLSALQALLGELSKDQDIIFYCN